MEWKNLANDSRYDQVKQQLRLWLPKTDAPFAPKDPPRQSAH